MSDEKDPVESHEDAASELRAAPSAKSALPPGVILAFVIIALLGVLIVMNLKSWSGASAVDSEELRKLNAEVTAAQANLNSSRLSLGLRPLEGGGEPIGDVAERMKKDADTMVALASSYETMLGEKDLEMKTIGDKLLTSEQLRKSLSDELERLRTQLNNATLAGLDLDKLRTQNDALAAEVARLRAKGETVPKAEMDELQRRLDEALRAKAFLEARIKELDGQLAKAKLFASSESELLPAAVELFRNLRQLEGKADSEIATAYSSLAVSLGANVLRTLNFETGKSDLSPADVEGINQLVSEMPDGDLLLVIGYASETGNVDSNQTLSSARATAAAEYYSTIKRPGQLVQAVYLGQTDRFSSRIPERNQIVEVWRIRKK